MNTVALFPVRWRRAWCLAAAMAMVGAAHAQSPAKGSPEHIRVATAKVNEAFMKANTRQTADWPSYGLDYAETRFSRLNQINASNVKDLGLVWSYNLESTRGHTAGG